MVIPYSCACFCFYFQFKSDQIIIHSLQRPHDFAFDSFFGFSNDDKNLNRSRLHSLLQIYLYRLPAISNSISQPSVSFAENLVFYFN